VNDFEFDGWDYQPLIRQGESQAVLFTVGGEPMVKSRPRMTKTGHAYTPKATKDAEARVADAYDGEMFTGNIGVELHFFQGSRARKDIDNMVKLVLDGLNGVAWPDDLAVSVCLARRVYTVKDRARTVVRVFNVSEGVDV
jgi:Holliday junction resolvase RusA-like endonuclease